MSFWGQLWRIWTDLEGSLQSVDRAHKPEADTACLGEGDPEYKPLLLLPSNQRG